MTQPNDYTQYNIILWNGDKFIYHYTTWFLNFDNLEQDFSSILFLRFDPATESPILNIPDLVNPIIPLINADPSIFLLLTLSKEPPVYRERQDEYIYSFCCNFQLFKELISSFGHTEFQQKHFLFELLDHIFQGKSGFRKILARQLPIVHKELTDTIPCSVIIPHKGNNDYLANLLLFLDQLDELHISVGLDQEIGTEIEELKTTYSDTSFYSFDPHPVGPYVIRNKLIENSTDQLIYFQDSDDIPCADRFQQLSAYMLEQGCQLCGSHEIKLDYYTRTVQAIRYPRNVSGALAKSGGHSLLHPSSAITRNAFYLGGKLSEERIFGNDTKFLYHSYFVFDSIQNIDEFLYIRRRHPNSLTTSPETSIGSPARSKLLLTWLKEFDRVKNGILRLENTTLNYSPSNINFKMKKL